MPKLLLAVLLLTGCDEIAANPDQPPQEGTPPYVTIYVSQHPNGVQCHTAQATSIRIAISCVKVD